MNEMKMLVEAPKTTIPRVIQRMQEKEELWIQEKCLLETVWTKNQIWLIEMAEIAKYELYEITRHL